MLENFYTTIKQFNCSRNNTFGIKEWKSSAVAVSSSVIKNCKK